MPTLKLDDASFESRVLQSETPVLVDFWAEWCRPCQLIAPALEEIANELEGRLTVAKINIDEDPEWAGRFNVRSIPTMMLFKGGELVATRMGADRKSAIKEWAEAQL